MTSKGSFFNDFFLKFNQLKAYSNFKLLLIIGLFEIHRGLFLCKLVLTFGNSKCYQNRLKTFFRLITSVTQSLE